MDQELNLTRIISELTQNSLDAKCKVIDITVNIIYKRHKYIYMVSVADDGIINGDISKFCLKGVSYKNSSGMALYYISEFCNKNGGSLKIERNNKTTIALSYESLLQDKLDGLDEVLYLLSINEIDLCFKLINKKNSFVYDTKEIKNILKEVSIKELEVMNFIKEYIRDGLNQK